MSSGAAGSGGLSMTDQMFGTEVQMEKRGPIVDRELLRPGAIVRHIRTEANIGENRSKKHHFSLPNGVHFSLWGSAQLNDKLRQVKPGAVVLLRYDGQDEDENKTHRWVVRPFMGNPKELKNVIDQEWGRKHAALSEAIEAAETQERSRRGDARQQAGEFAPPDDSDLKW